MPSKLIPREFNKIGHRIDSFLHTEVTIYKRAHPKAYLIDVNDKLLPILNSNEVMCMLESLRNDVEIK